MDDALGAESVDPGGLEDAARAHLVIVGGAEVGRLLHLSEEELVLGRAPDVNGCLKDVSISQRHAKVIWHDGRHLLVDLGSTNGTFVNDKRIRGPVALTHRDTVRVGQTQLKFLARADATRGRDATVRLELPHEEPKAKRDMVRYRDSRLVSAPRHDLTSRPSSAALSKPDWVVYVRSATDYTKRYGKFVIAMALLGFAAGAAHAVLKPPLGSAFFEIALSREAKYNPVEEERSVQFFVAAEKSFTSVPLIKETLKGLGMEASDGLARSVQERLSFGAVDQTEQVWRGEYTARTAEDAEALLVAHLKTYLEREVDKNLKVLRAEISLLEGQLEKNAKQLRDTEAALADFKKAHPGLVTSDGTTDQFASLDGLTARRDELSAQVQRLQLELNLNKKRLSSGDALLSGRVASASSYTTGLQDVEKQISEAKAEGLGEEHPKIKKLRAQAKELANLKLTTIEKESTDVERRSNESYVAVRERVKDLEVALQVAQTELGQLGQRLRNVSDKAKALPGAEVELSKLTRNYASTKALHDRLYQKLQASRIQLQMEQASSRARYDVITPPTQSAPDMTLAIAQRGGVAGVVLLFLAVLFAVAREGVRYLRSVL